MGNIVVQSKSPKWKLVDLNLTRLKNDLSGEVLTFKEIEWQTLRIEANALDSLNKYTTPLRLIASQSKIRITIKKRLNDCSVVNSRIQVNLDDLLWVLTDAQIFAALTFSNFINKFIQKSKITQATDQSFSKNSIKNNFAPPKSMSGGSKSQQMRAKLFDMFDITESSYHVLITRIELHLCDDTSITSNKRFKITDGAMHLILYSLKLDFYLSRFACAPRHRWLNYDETSSSRESWAAKLFNLHQSINKTFEPLATVASPMNIFMDKNIRDDSALDTKSFLKMSDSSSAINIPSPQLTLPDFPIPQQKSAPGTPMHQTSAKQPTVIMSKHMSHELMEGAISVHLADFVLFKVSTSANMAKEAGKFISSDKHRLHLPKDMASFRVELTDFFYDDLSVNKYIPPSNLYIMLNPVLINIDYSTILWLNSFLLNIAKRAEEIPKKLSNPKHMDVRFEALMPRVCSPCCDLIVNSKNEIEKIEILASRIIASNHIDATADSTTLKSTLKILNDGKNLVSDEVSGRDKIKNESKNLPLKDLNLCGRDRIFEDEGDLITEDTNCDSYFTSNINKPDDFDIKTDTKYSKTKNFNNFPFDEGVNNIPVDPIPQRFYEYVEETDYVNDFINNLLEGGLSSRGENLRVLDKIISNIKNPDLDLWNVNVEQFWVDYICQSRDLINGGVGDNDKDVGNKFEDQKLTVHSEDELLENFQELKNKKILRSCIESFPVELWIQADLSANVINILGTTLKSICIQVNGDGVAFFNKLLDDLTKLFDEIKADKFHIFEKKFDDVNENITKNIVDIQITTRIVCDQATLLLLLPTSQNFQPFNDSQILSPTDPLKTSVDSISKIDNLTNKLTEFEEVNNGKNEVDIMIGNLNLNTNNIHECNLKKKEPVIGWERLRDNVENEWDSIGKNSNPGSFSWLPTGKLFEMDSIKSEHFNITHSQNDLLNVQQTMTSSNKNSSSTGSLSQNFKNAKNGDDNWDNHSLASEDDDASALIEHLKQPEMPVFEKNFEENISDTTGLDDIDSGASSLVLKRKQVYVVKSIFNKIEICCQLIDDVIILNGVICNAHLYECGCVQLDQLQTPAFSESLQNIHEFQAIKISNEPKVIFSIFIGQKSQLISMFAHQQSNQNNEIDNKLNNEFKIINEKSKYDAIYKTNQMHLAFNSSEPELKIVRARFRKIGACLQKCTLDKIAEMVHADNNDLIIIDARVSDIHFVLLDENRSPNDMVVHSLCIFIDLNRDIHINPPIKTTILSYFAMHGHHNSYILCENKALDRSKKIDEFGYSLDICTENVHCKQNKYHFDNLKQDTKIEESFFDISKKNYNKFPTLEEENELLKLQIQKLAQYSMCSKCGLLNNFNLSLNDTYNIEKDIFNSQPSINVCDDSVLRTNVDSVINYKIKNHTGDCEKVKLELECLKEERDSLLKIVENLQTELYNSEKMRNK